MKVIKVDYNDYNNGDENTELFEVSKWGYNKALEFVKKSFDAYEFEPEEIADFTWYSNSSSGNKEPPSFEEFLQRRYVGFSDDCDIYYYIKQVEVHCRNNYMSIE